jgi:hypothetical protein
MAYIKGHVVYKVVGGTPKRWNPLGSKMYRDVNWKPEATAEIAEGGFATFMRNHGFRSCDNPPSFRQLEHWGMDSVCDATDGCQVEPDGDCEHGHISWLRVVGVI